MTKLTIMVSLYNSGDWLENRLNNLLASKFINRCEIFCLNANSPDPRDHEIPQRFPVRYEKLDERNTVYEAWNYIISNSTSDYITNANTDDIVHPEAYANMFNILDNNVNVGLTYVSWYAFHYANPCWEQLTGYQVESPGHYHGSVENSTVGHFPMWRRSLHDKIGLFDTSFKALADAEWWARIYYKGKCDFHWITRPLGGYYYRNGENLWHKSITAEEWEMYHTKVNEYKKERL